MHLNLTYLLEADENETLKIKEDENKGVKWFELEKVKEVSNEEWMIKNVYKKLNEKLEEYKTNKNK